MGFDGRAIDRDCSDDPCRPGQHLEDLEPYALPAPSVEAIVDCGVGAVRGGTIAPARARAKHVNDAADHPPIVDPMCTSPAARHQRFDLRPLGIRQPILSWTPKMRQLVKVEPCP